MRKNLHLGLTASILAALFYLYEYVVRVMPEAMSHQLMQQYHIGAGHLGIMSALFFWGYAPMQIVSGYVLDRIPIRYALSSSTIICAISVLISIYSNDFATAALFRFLSGIAASFAFVGALMVGAYWLKGAHMSLFSGCVQFTGCLGAIIGISGLTQATEQIGWTKTSIIIAVFGILLGILLFFIRIQSDKLHCPDKQLSWQPFTQTHTWITALYGFAIWSPITVFGAMWGKDFLATKYLLSDVDASQLLCWNLWIGVAILAPITGWLSNSIQSRRIPMCLCSLAGLISSLLLLYSQQSPIMLSLTLWGLALGGAGLSMSFGLVTDTQKKSVTGVVIGFTNCAVILGGTVLVPLVGYILSRLWHGQTSQGVPYYSTGEQTIALSIVPLCFFIAFIATLLTKETHCQNQHDDWE